MKIEETLRSEARKIGIPLFGIAKPQKPAHYEHFFSWIAAQKQGSMDYLARPDALQKREDPFLLLPEVKSILVFGFPYQPGTNPVLPPTDRPWGRVASYAWSADYHAVLPSLLDQWISSIRPFLPRIPAHRSFCDTAPIMERDFGQLAGLGWIGKNTCLITPGLGSFYLLAEVFLDFDLEPSEPFRKDHCGTCQRCIQACPTQCISAEDRTIDARRCISYLTIENKREIPRDLRAAVGNWVFGCDICQNVCPWNQKTTHHHTIAELQNNNQPHFIDLHQEIYLTLPEFKNRYAGSPILRAKRSGFLRNVICALGNENDPASIIHLKYVLEHEPDPLLRSHASWALGQYSDKTVRSFLESVLNKETNLQVIDEIQWALSDV